MRTGVGLTFICAGAILAFAVTASTPVINLHTAGWVIMLVGLTGLVTPRSTYGWVGRRLLLRRTRAYPATRVEEVDTPVYVARNPKSSQISAGSVARGPTDTEVIEDIYEP